jgi:hypothetical protein
MTTHASPIFLFSSARSGPNIPIGHWRDSTLEGLAPSSVNSCAAALTQADKTRATYWRGGLQALPDATEANSVVIEDEKA